MARKLKDIFNECYERMLLGESLRSCLARYPEYRTELEPLLKTASDIGRRASCIQPRPEFKHWTQVRLQGAQHYQQIQVGKPSRFSWLRQSWAMAIAAVLILLLTTGSTMAASSNAMPDQTLYPVKLATEEMRLAFAFSEEREAEVHTQLALTRAVEVEVMANEGKAEHAAITAARLAKQLEQANSAIATVESAVGKAPPPAATPEPIKIEPLPPTPPEDVPAVQPPVTEEQPKTIEGPKTTPAATEYDKWAAKKQRLENSLEESKSKSQAALEKAKEDAPQETKDDWQQVIDIIREKQKENQKENQSNKNSTRDWQNDKGNGKK